MICSFASSSEQIDEKEIGCVTESNLCHKDAVG